MEIDLNKLTEHKDLIGCVVKEHGIDKEGKLSGFKIENGFLSIYDTNGYIGGVNVEYGRAYLGGDNNLYITGAYCPTFVVYTKEKQ